MADSSKDIPALAAEAVLVQSQQMPQDSVEVKGYDFNNGINHHALLQSYLTSGFQATNFGLAVEQINSMIAKRQEPLPKDKLQARQELEAASTSNDKCLKED